MLKSPIHRTIVKIVCLIAYCVINTQLYSQRYNIGAPSITNFTPEAYNASPQNWDIKCTNNGLIYAANNDGLMVSDGLNWYLYPQPNRTIAWSFDFLDRNKIIVGGQDEFGIYKPAYNGQLEYENLVDSIPEAYRSFGDIWEIIGNESNAFYRNESSIFQFKNKQILIIEKDVNPSFVTHSKGILYYNKENIGIFKRPFNEEAEFIESSNQIKDAEIIAFLPLAQDSNVFLIFTEENGIYKLDGNSLQPWKNNASSYFQEKFIHSALILENGNIVVGTRLGGLVILNDQGIAQYKIDKKSGLQNNTINSISEDIWGNLWVASYFGIDKIDLSSSLTYFYPDSELQGAVYDIAFWKDKWWFGTANGLYSLAHQDYYNPFEQKSFEIVEGSQGQVWGLDIIQDELFLAHHNGAYKVKENGSIESFGNINGAWKFVPLSTSKLAVGSYTGVYLFDKIEEEWVLHSKVKNFQESSRIIVTDLEQNLWVSHPYRGVYKIKFDPSFNQTEITNYMPKSSNSEVKENYIFNINNTLCLVNNKGLFQYNSTLDKFGPDEELSSLLLESGRIRKFINSDHGIWYISEHETGYIHKENIGLKEQLHVKRFSALSDLYVGGFENLHPISEDDQFLCTSKGVLYHTAQKYHGEEPLEAYISEIRLTKNDSIIKTVFTPTIPLTLNSNQNALSFSFRSNGKLNKELQGYSYKMEGIDENWSEINKKNTKEYTNIRHGDYVFLLRSINRNGQISAIHKTSINIKTPWYYSKTANIVYALLVLSTILALLLIPRKKYKKNTAQLVSKQKETEQKMELIKKEKLENEIQFKNKELASSTLHLLQKNQTLLNVRTEINSLRKKVKDVQYKKGLDNIISFLRSDLRLDEDWDRFSIHFDQVHHDFIKKIKDQYPALTPKDHQLCAYLKMNLTTKEIAPLLNISVRGVEISRYRLRKKLDLDKSVNLNEFMNQF